jgi:hypothetical protein
MIRLNIVNPVVRALLILLMTVFLLPLASANEGSGFVVVADGETKNASGQTLRLTAQATFFTGILVDAGHTTDCASHEERWEEFPVTFTDGGGPWEITNPDHSKFASGTWDVTSGIRFRDDGVFQRSHHGRLLQLTINHGGLLQLTVTFTTTYGQPFPGGNLQTMTLVIPLTSDGLRDDDCNAVLVGAFNIPVTKIFPLILEIPINRHH